MGLSVVHTNKVVIDVEAIARRAAALVPGLILKRCSEGRDTSDKPFRPYSGSYMHALVFVGESTVVDLRLTGGMLNSVKLRETRKVPGGVELVFGPDTGTSPGVRLPPPWVLSDPKAAAAWKKKYGSGLPRTGKRSPPHNVVGYWIHHGTPKMPARPWLGLSPRDAASLRKALEAATVVRK
jgi:hypothetical protein